MKCPIERMIFLHEMRNAGLAGILQSLWRLERVYARGGFAKNAHPAARGIWLYDQWRRAVP
jgi:hypothetical protein